jgi:hypothetical protein
MTPRQQHIIETALAQAKHLREHYGPAHVINLSLYATDADLRQLRPEDGPEATAAEQRQITEAVAAALRADGQLVKLITLRAVNYLTWLTTTGKTNNPATRAEWLTWQQR